MMRLVVTRRSIVEIHKDETSFSAGHFTIFSATEREGLHGHNYNVSMALETTLADDGLSFDYRFYKTKLQNLAKQLDRRFLLPAHSRFLKLEETHDGWLAHFNHERIPFLKCDVLILPLTNITIEELSHWFLQRLTEHPCPLWQHHVQSLTVKVYNGPGQSGSAMWLNQI
jgi:6-pyruvoyltetrahydropterin/6-carboxytetrahydropterin synthase